MRTLPFMFSGAGGCGKLYCQVQAGVKVGVGNLGDSRAVMGKYRGGQLWTVPLSEDHAVTNEAERERMMEEQRPCLFRRKCTQVQTSPLKL
jgi:serine/threonine protein phosphatase PrpC